MSTIKISELTEKATMAGTEEVLINDSGASKKFSTQRFLDVKTAAETAKTAAETAQTAAELAETHAETAETNAETAETNASGHAGTASTQAGIATTKAGAANTSATSASGSATAAANSAASAASTFDAFDDRYLGNLSSAPAVDNDGNALASGALYFNTTTNNMMVWDGSAWITTSSATLTTLDTYKFTATSGQTVFTGTDDASNTLAIKPTAEIVTLNGIVLESATDYTVTTTTLTLLVGATLNDDVNVLAFGNFELADHYSKVAADARFEPIDSAYTKSEGDARYAAISVVNYDASTIQAEVDLNTAKTGITSGQASAITANTAKVTYPSAASTKLGGIEASADVTDTTNVTAAGAAMLTGAAFTGAITTNSTFDGVDIATRDGVLTTTTTTAGAALPKAGGTMTGTITLGTNNVTFTNWTVTEVGGVLRFATGGTTKMSVDASGNAIFSGDVTAFGTPA